jgi:hypothetical protein
MLLVLLIAECTGVVAAINIFAWVRSPFRDFTPARAALMRILSPPYTLLLLAATLAAFVRWQRGNPLGPEPPATLVIAGAGFMAATLAMLIADIRHRRATR